MKMFLTLIVMLTCAQSVTCSQYLANRVTQLEERTSCTESFLDELDESVEACEQLSTAINRE